MLKNVQKGVRIIANAILTGLVIIYCLPAIYFGEKSVIPCKHNCQRMLNVYEDLSVKQQVNNQALIGEKRSIKEKEKQHGNNTEMENIALLNRTKTKAGEIQENSPEMYDHDSHHQDIINKYGPFKLVSWDDLSSGREAPFNQSDPLDTMVFLHIQKTGGSTFGAHLVDLAMDPPCKCKHAHTYGAATCRCPRVMDVKGTGWLFSRYTNGWPCDSHAGWNELDRCVQRRIFTRNQYFYGNRSNLKPWRLFYVTILREPMQRYLSEYGHTFNKGDWWRTSKHRCQGKTIKNSNCNFSKRMPFSDFLGCNNTWSTNRQTTMVGDMSETGCYTPGDYIVNPALGIPLVESAQQNLLKMAYFGLTEYQRKSQLLFERIFGIKFRKDFIQRSKQKSLSLLEQGLVNHDQDALMRKRNAMDIPLYDFAKKIFEERVKEAEINLEAVPGASDNLALIPGVQK